MPDVQSNAELLEQGDLVFLYRPKVNEDAPSGPGDVQRFFLAMRPAGGKAVRLCVVGRKHLPDAERHERLWGFVGTVAESGAALERELREEHYETKTRGEQEQPAARPAGEGIYAVTLEDGQMHLSYRLELPARPGEVQTAFNIAPTASYALSVKTPETGQPKGAGLGPEAQADYPDRLQKTFRGRRFEAEDARMLNHEGAEFILVGARQDPEAAYSLELHAEHEDYGSADATRRLRLVKSRHPVAPLFEGRWD